VLSDDGRVRLHRAGGGQRHGGNRTFRDDPARDDRGCPRPQHVDHLAARPLQDRVTGSRERRVNIRLRRKYPIDGADCSGCETALRTSGCRSLFRQSPRHSTPLHSNSIRFDSIRFDKIPPIRATRGRPASASPDGADAGDIPLRGGSRSHAAERDRWRATGGMRFA
jgi:hypothetical protein